MASAVPCRAATQQNDIAYDSVYDEIQFGFGDKFIKQVLGEVAGGAQPTVRPAWLLS